jgi:DNA helicase HerA-like ATPase
MADGEGILLGKGGGVAVHLLPRMANRHGLIAGATGTGKTVTLRVIAEQMAKIGVPCFVADV